MRTGWLKTDFNTDFIRNTFLMLSGNTVAQAISLVTLPILTRIYSPEDFGKIALYISVVNIMGMISTARYEMALVIQKDDRDALDLFKTILWIVVLVSLFSGIVIFLFFTSIKNLLRIGSEIYIIYSIPLLVCFNGLYNLFQYWLIRDKEFGILSKNKVAVNGSQSFTRLLYGFFSPSLSGLFAGFAMGQIVPPLLLFRKIKRRNQGDFFVFNRNRMLKMLKQNIDFPSNLLPMSVLNAVSVDLLLYVLTSFFGTFTVGLYFNARRILSFPLTLISSAFSPVFFQRFTEKKNGKSSFYLYSYLFNLGLGTLILLPMFFWGEDLVLFFLGDKWAGAGRYAAIIAPYSIVGFAMETVSNVFSAVKENKWLLWWQVTFFIFAILLLYIMKDDNIEFVLRMYTVFSCIFYIILAVIGYKIVIKHDSDKA